MNPGWHRYRPRDKCCICGHMTSGCAYMGPLEAPYLVLCLRVEQGGIKEARNGMGWVHKVNDNPHAPRYVPTPKPKSQHDPRFLKLAQAWEANCDYDGSRAYVANLMGVSEDSLCRLAMGFDENTLAYSFPMRNGQGHVIGIRLRMLTGKKWAVAGSANGIFIPRRLPLTGTLYVCEGPTDTAAALTMGLCAIGRASNTSGRDFIIEYAKRFLPRRKVVIIKNNDTPGTRAEELTRLGAETLAGELLNQDAASDVDIVMPPTKDLRALLLSGVKTFDCQPGHELNAYSGADRQAVASAIVDNAVLEPA
jgi:hypothetical protein